MGLGRRLAQRSGESVQLPSRPRQTGLLSSARARVPYTLLQQRNQTQQARLQAPAQDTPFHSPSSGSLMKAGWKMRPFPWPCLSPVFPS